MESKSKLVLLAVAGVIVAFAAIAVRNRMTDEPPPPLVEAQSNRVIAAKHDLAPGSFVQPQDLDWLTLEPENVKEGYLREGSARLEDFAGAVVRRQMKAGEPLSQSSLTRSGEGGFMSAVLEPGMRAVSVAVTATSGNAGFIWPGDRVDLILVRRVSNKTGGESIVSETFVQDVRVVAVDQMLDNPDNKAILAKTVTVEVAPEQAEQISTASELGKISLALRSLAAATPPKKEASAGEVPLKDLYGNAVDGEAIAHDGLRPRVRVIRGDEVENVDTY